MTDICARCLINLDAGTMILARFPVLAPDLSPFVNTTDPWALKEWAINMLEQGATIDVDATADRFRPVATWHGDPVCVVHLWERRDAEMRAEGMRRR